MGRHRAIASVLAVWACLTGCRRASDEARTDPRTDPRTDQRTASRDSTDDGTPVEHPGLVEHVLPSVGLPAPTAGPIGTAHPTSITQVAENGRWLVACQARVDTNRDGVVEVNVGHHGELYGDSARPYLFRGGGEGQAIDELVAVSRDERYLAIMRDGALVVIDDASGRETTITDADVSPDQRGRARVAEFDAESKRVIYFRANEPSTIVIRELATPRERVVKMPGVRAWNVVAEQGNFARFRFLRDDTDGNGVLEWPTIHTTAAIGEICTGPALSYSVSGGAGDEPRDAWLDVERGTVREDASVLAHVGRHARGGMVYDELARAKDGAITLAGATLVPASCKATAVHAVLAAPLRVAVVCAGARADGDTATVVDVYGPGFHAELEMKADRDSRRPPRMLTSSVFCQNADVCHDLVTGKRFMSRGPMVAQHGAALLSRAGGAVYWMASSTAAPVLVPKIDSSYPDAFAGSLVALDNGIVDLATGRLLGYAPKTPLAIDVRGRSLVVADESGRGLPLGPLTWADPVPTPPTRD